MKLTDRLQHAWNVFMNKDPTSQGSFTEKTSYRPDRVRLTKGHERTIITSIFNRIALDVAQVDFNHVRIDDDGKFTAIIPSSLNNCLSLEANLDQTARAFIQDVIISLLDEGSVAIVPVETSTDISEPFGIVSMRVGKIVDWSPSMVTVRLYDERDGKTKDISVPKKATAILENPFYAIINQPNSTLKRLVRKLNLLDAVDEQSSSGKLDVIIQLPYQVKTEAKRKMAEERRADMEEQLYGSKYGIAYVDATEKITQLNRPVENNLMKQVEYLTGMLMAQMSVTQGILDGTADDRTMTNYYSRTIEPFLNAITDEYKRKFLTKTARTQKQSIMYFRNYFKMIPITSLADIADKLTRNEIATSNEFRQVLGLRPSKDPKADELRNKNINQPDQGLNNVPKEDNQNENQPI